MPHPRRAKSRCYALSATQFRLYSSTRTWWARSVGQETIHVTLEPLSTEESSRIWALFPTANYRTSVAYVASPVWIDPPQPEIEAAPVTTDALNAGTLEATQ